MSTKTNISEYGNNEFIICQYCTKETPIIYNFCAQCHKQIKCLECGAKTFSSADFCLACSKPLINRENISKPTNLYTRNVKKEGDNYEENIRFELSDDSVGKIAPFIVKQTMSGTKPISLATNALNESLKEDDTEFEDISSESKVATSKEDEQENKVPTIPIANQTASPNNNVSQFFKNDSGNIIAIENDFRGKTWTEQQKNFIIVFTKAYQELLGKPIPNKEVIKEAAKKLSIVDNNNFTNYLNKVTDDCMAKLNDGLELNAKGNKEASRIIKLMEDDSTPSGFDYSKKSTTNTIKRLRISGDERSLVVEWIKDEVALGKLDVRDVKTGRDAALLALWIITVKLEKTKASYIHLFMEYLNKKFTTISVTSPAVNKALTVSKESEKYFQKTSDGKYFLSTVGQQLVEEWINGVKSIKKDTE